MGENNLHGFDLRQKTINVEAGSRGDAERIEGFSLRFNHCSFVRGLTLIYHLT